MSDDAIVTDGRHQRARLLQTAGGSLEALIQYLRQRETEAGRKPVRLGPQEPVAGPRAG